jgi:hypothetical protein
MTLSRIFEIVSISYRGKEAMLAHVIKLDTFTLSTHEVLEVKVVVVVFFSVMVAIWVVRGFVMFFGWF